MPTHDFSLAWFVCPLSVTFMHPDLHVDVIWQVCSLIGSNDTLCYIGWPSMKGNQIIQLLVLCYLASGNEWFCFFCFFFVFFGLCLVLYAVNFDAAGSFFPWSVAFCITCFIDLK